jgi:hypothetical protein
MRPWHAGLAILLSLSCSCRDRPPQDQQPHTQRERDSVLGASRLPGAAGVRGALRVSDSAAARRAVEDSAARSP